MNNWIQRVLHDKTTVPPLWIFPLVLVLLFVWTRPIGPVVWAKQYFPDWGDVQDNPFVEDLTNE